MSKLLIQLLGVSERDFTSFIKRVELVCLNPGIDIRLATEIKSRVRAKIADLGLDPHDTTSKELYYALRSKLSEDDAKLKKIFKVDNRNPEQVAKILVKFANKLCIDDQVLCLTSAGTKRVLSAVPPRKTMKLLKLRSLESVLKREDPKVLFTLAMMIEDESWTSQVHAKIKRLQSRDIAWQPVYFSTVPGKWLEKIQNKLQLKGLSVSSPEVGSVIAIPVIEKLLPGATLLAIGHLLQVANKLCIESMPHRLHGLSSGYDKVLMDITLRKEHELFTIHGIVPSWSVVHELVGTGKLRLEEAIGDISIKEISWQTVEAKIATLSDDLAYWSDTRYLAYDDEYGTTSLHMLDVARSLLLQHTFEQRSKQHLEQSLWNEIQTRYLQEDNLSRALIKQLQPKQSDMLL